jgi:hypothetical protein
MATAAIGHNQPPATPYDALKAHIDDLEMEARNFLDGKPIETDEQAEAINKIREDARKARQAAEEQRKLEAKPFDEGKKAVQERWTPFTDEKKGRCALIEDVCKQALAPFLIKKDEAQRAAAQAATLEARRQAEAAAQAAEQASPSDLAGMTTARVLQENAAAAAKVAQKLDKARPQARGGERAVGLKSVWAPILTDSVAALRHYRERQPEALKSWLLEQAFKDVRAGAREIPGFTISETKTAV